MRLTLLELKFFNTRLVGRDGGAFDTNRVLLDRLGSINGNLIVCLVTVLEAQIVVLEIDVEVGEDELLLDIFPDNPGHLVPVQLDDGILDLDLLRHVGSGMVKEGYGYGRPNDGNGR